MKACEICGKGSIMRGQRRLLRGHYNPIEKQRKYPNLQWVRLPAQAGFNSKKVKACTNCLRTISKRSAEATAKAKA